MGKHLPTDVKALARSHTKSALRVLTGIMRNAKAPHSARVTAALGILDRGWGKAAQAVELTGEVTTKVIRTGPDVANIDEWSREFAPKQTDSLN